MTIDCANLYSWESEIFDIWYFNFILTLIMTARHHMVIGLCSRIFQTHANSNQHIPFYLSPRETMPHFTRVFIWVGVGYLPAIFSVYPSVSHSNPYFSFWSLLLVSFESLLFPFNHLITNLRPFYYFLIKRTLNFQQNLKIIKMEVLIQEMTKRFLIREQDHGYKVFHCLKSG